MNNMIKVTCARCDGSGKFSFNLVKGDVCFGCDGVGYKLVDEKKHNASVARSTKAKQSKKELMQRRVEIANELYEKFKVEFNYTNDNSAKESYEIGVLVQQKYGKTIADFVNELI